MVFSPRPPAFRSVRNNKQTEDSFEDDNDVLDFTYPHNRRNISDFVSFYVFCYFYKLALLVFLLVGVSSAIISYTEIISCIYFFVGINLLFHSQTLEAQKHKIWDRLIFLNTLVMIMMSLY